MVVVTELGLRSLLVGDHRKPNVGLLGPARSELKAPVAGSKRQSL